MKFLCSKDVRGVFKIGILATKTGIELHDILFVNIAWFPPSCTDQENGDTEESSSIHALLSR